MKSSKNKFIAVLIAIVFIFIFLPATTCANPKADEKGWITKLVKLEEAEPKYEITCKFPEFKNKETTDFTDLNKKLESLVRERIIESKNNFGKRESKGKVGSYLLMNYDIYQANKNLVSVVFSIESYGAGAAHPIHWTEAVNYDLGKNRPLRLPYILINSNNYLNKLSKLCIADLKTQKGLKDLYWIKEGAGPKAKNFTSFYLDKNGIGIIFDEYKVGPYVAGAHSVHIPYSKLKEDLNLDLALSK